MNPRNQPQDDNGVPVTVFISQLLQSHPQPTRRRGCGWLLTVFGILAAVLGGGLGCLVGALAIVGLFVPDVANWSANLSANIFGTDLIETVEVPGGNASAFDPIVNFEQVAAFAGEGAELTEIRALYVKSDGTLDLTASNYVAYVDFTFARETTQPADAPPVGVSGNTGGTWYETISVMLMQPGQRRQTTTTSGGVRSTVQWVNKGMTRDIDDVSTRVPLIIPTPTCSFADLWAYALEQEAPRDAVAMISYDSNGYDFNISGTSFNYEFDTDCQPKR